MFLCNISSFVQVSLPSISANASVPNHPDQAKRCERQMFWICIKNIFESYFYQSFPSSQLSPSKMTPAPLFLETTGPATLPRWLLNYQYILICDCVIIWDLRSVARLPHSGDVLDLWIHNVRVYLDLFVKTEWCLSREEKTLQDWIKQGGVCSCSSASSSSSPSAASSSSLLSPSSPSAAAASSSSSMLLSGLHQARGSEVGHLCKWIWRLLSLWVFSLSVSFLFYESHFLLFKMPLRDFHFVSSWSFTISFLLLLLLTSYYPTPTQLNRGYNILSCIFTQRSTEQEDIWRRREKVEALVPGSLFSQSVESKVQGRYADWTQAPARSTWWKNPTLGLFFPLPFLTWQKGQMV